MNKITKDRMPLTRLPGLAIVVNCQLSLSMANELDEFHADCLGIEAAIAELQADRRALLDRAMDATLRNLVDDGEELEQRRHELERELLRLHWRRFHLLPKLVPDLQRAVEDAARQHDLVLEDTIAQMRRSGADRDIPAIGDPTNGIPPRFIAGTDAQVAYVARQQIPAIQAAGVLNLAKDALNALKSQIGLPPHTSYCEITWQSDGPQFTIAKQARLATEGK